MEAEEWLASYDKRLTEIAARAKEAGARLRRVGGSATSPRGEVEVRVSASGTLEDLTLTPAARTLESDELARLILDTTHAARRAVGAQVVGISAGYFGQGPVHEVVKQHQPADVPAPAAVRAAPLDTDDDYFANPPEITR